MQTNSKENINTWLSQITTDYKAAISVDCVVFGYDKEGLKVMVLECNMPPFEGLPSLVGDLVRPNETMDQATERILVKRTGLKNLYLEQVETFSAVDRHPLGRVVSTAYYTLMRVEDYEFGQNETQDKVSWKEINDIDQMAFDHNLILENCLDRLRKSLIEKPIGFSLLPNRFTLKQLQLLYELILNIKLDKRNFRRKLKALDILEEHRDTQRDVSHRPAKLYSFNKESYVEKRKNKGIEFNF